MALTSEQTIDSLTITRLRAYLESLESAITKYICASPGGTWRMPNTSEEAKAMFELQTVHMLVREYLSTNIWPRSEKEQECP